MMSSRGHGARKVNLDSYHAGDGGHTDPTLRASYFGFDVSKKKNAMKYPFGSSLSQIRPAAAVRMRYAAKCGEKCCTHDRNIA